jgi:hypothetical protein
MDLNGIPTFQSSKYSTSSEWKPNRKPTTRRCKAELSETSADFIEQHGVDKQIIRFILLLSHLRISLPSDFLFLGLSAHIFIRISQLPLCATRLIHHIVLDLITLIIYG